MNRNKDEKRQDLIDYNNNRYIFFSSSLKISNYLSNLGKKTKSLTCFVSI